MMVKILLVFSSLLSLRWSVDAAAFFTEEAKQAADFGIPPQTSILVVTHKSIRIQPIALPDHYRRIELPYHMWIGANIDFDFDQETTNKVALLTGTKDGNQLHIIDFSSNITYSDLPITPKVSNAINVTSPAGYFTADKVRFSTDYAAAASSAPFNLWSSAHRSFTDSPFNINRARCSPKKEAVSELECTISEHKISKEPFDSAKQIIDVARGSGAGFFTIFESTKRGTTDSEFYIADSQNFAKLTPLPGYLPKASLALSYDSVRNQLWVIGISVHSRLILARVSENKIARTFVVELPPWCVVEKVERLSVNDNIVCISFKQSGHRMDAVAVAKVDENDPESKLHAMPIEVDGLIGATCLSQKHLEVFNRFAPEFTHISSDPDSGDRSHDKGYLALIAIGLVSIFLGLVLALGSAYLFHLKRRMLTFQRFDRVLFHKHGYEDAEADADDDRFLLKKGADETTESSSVSKSGDSTTPLNAQKNDESAYESAPINL